MWQTGSGFKFYLKAKEATAEGETVILTATAGAKDAEGGDVTATAEITVNEGVNTAELQALIEKYNDLSKEVYTEESYDAFKTAFDAASDLLLSGEFTKNEVENAAKMLSDAADALVFRPIDEEYAD